MFRSPFKLGFTCLSRKMFPKKKNFLCEFFVLACFKQSKTPSNVIFKSRYKAKAMSQPVEIYYTSRVFSLMTIKIEILHDFEFLKNVFALTCILHYDFEL